jgi:hypothetical protein
VILDELEAALGHDRVTRTIDGDRDERTAMHISGRDIGRPLAWVRPPSAEAIATVVRCAASARVRVVALGAATTYWDPVRVAGAIVVDTRALDAPIAIDPIARIARAGAGVVVREVDRRARRDGLCLMARPDGGGDTPVGGLVAVGSTAGLGLGVASPIELVAGATLVSGRGEVLRVGASHALHGEPFARHGAPEALGLVAAAEGRGAIVAEVGLLLHPAPHVVTVRARGDAPLVELLAIARRAIDAGRLESQRIERTRDLEVMARTVGRAGPAEALDGARALAAAWRAAGLSVAAPEIEPDDARLGVEPAYQYHWTFPAGEHRARLLGGALWGVEVGVSWRGVAACIERLVRLHRELDDLPLLVKRLALYPAAHSVTVGVQAIVQRGGDVDAVVAKLSDALPDLLACGAVPYRAGGLWRAALERHGARDVAGELARALDPDGVIGGRPW